MRSAVSTPHPVVAKNGSQCQLLLGWLSVLTLLLLLVATPPAGAQADPAAADWRAVPTQNLRVEGLAEWPASWPETIMLPRGTHIREITVSGGTATVVFTGNVLQGLDDARLTALFDQVRWLFYDVPEVTSIQLTCNDKLLSSYIPPAETPAPAPDAFAPAPGTTPPHTLAVAGLAGKSITIGPSHGRLWNGSAWGWQRGDDCGFGEDVLEDTNSIRLMQFLKQYLTQDGATVHVPRQMDETDCCHPDENRYWWHLAAYSWLYHLGYPCSVWGSNTGSCTSDTGPNRYNDDIRARPLFADYHNTDIYISHHTNAYNGVASGTISFYDTAMEHPEHEADSYTLATLVQSNICNVIKNVYGISDWYDRGANDSAGAYGEIRIPDRPACLIELAFHDQCTRDALFLKDNWFRSLTMWSIYKGVCEYFGNTPTWDMYSCEYVSDTIPANVTPSQVFNVTITYRNRGVLWTTDRSFKLGAVGDSDPFTAFNRVALTGEVRPGDTQIFTFTMTAPTTPNIYTTDWQMTRDGIAWFGPVVSKQVTVGTGPFPPSITVQPVSQSIVAGGTASFSIEAIGTTPLTYQWQKNGANVTNGGHYAGCTTTTLTISSADSGDAATYRCVVTNAYGNANSNNVTLTVETQPVVYVVESRSGGQNYTQYAETGTWGNSTAKSTASGCTSGIGSRYCTIGTSAGTAVYKFTPPATGSYQVFTTNCTTTNSGNPMIHIVTHAGGSNSVGVCQNSTCEQNACNNWYSLGTYTLNAATEYTVTLNGYTSAGSLPSGNAGRSDAIKWESVGGTGNAPSITQHPTNQSVSTGGTASFTVVASGTSPLTYQWQKNQVNVTDGGHYAGCTGATLTISSADSNDAANYRCVVTNAYGNATSNEATLTVTNPSITQFRGFWADVWGVGYKTAADINNMVSRAVAGRYNVIYPEVVAYHDNAVAGHGAYWNSSIVPKAPDIETGLDPLAYLCQQAHAQGIQVHAWIVPFRVSTAWPPAGNTILSSHGEYIMVPRASAGGGPAAISGNYYLDPGSPDVQAYILSIVNELVTNYPIDGVQFDYIRYVQQDAGYPSSSSYTNSGLKRFQRITGRTDTPAATGDTQWDDFRRRTITELVRRTRAEIPGMTSAQQPVRFSTAVVTWGDAPANFSGCGAYGLFCNWEEWQRLAFLDTCVPMTYYAESSYPTWYRNWVDAEMDWSYDRQMVVGPGVYMNTFAQSVAQIQYALNAGADGVCTYNYRDTTSDASDPWDWYPYVATNVFTQTAAVPSMPWRNPATATEGTLWGRVTDSSTGNPIDDATVQVGSLDAVKSDGNGYYVVTLIPASGSGTNYSMTVSKANYVTANRAIQVVAGSVTREDFSLVAGGDAPTITQHPAGVSVILGSTAVLAVQADGATPFTYQWQKNQVNVTNGGHYSGCTTASLAISSVDGNDLANYRCVVTNAYGNATSNEAAVTAGGALVDSYIVESRSGGLNYASYSETGTWSSSTAKSTASGCTAGIGSRYCTIGTSAGTAIMHFTPSTTASYEIFTTNATTTNSGNPMIHTVMHAGGSTFNVGVCQNSGCTPNPCNVWRSIGTYSLNASTEYTVTLNGYTSAGSAPSGYAGRSDAIRWCRVSGTAPPTITQQPAAQNVCPGATATFTVAASGGGTLTYQWQKGQVNITNGGHYAGCTTTTLTVSSADSGDAANYRCVVSNEGGSTNSDEAALTLKATTTITQHPQNQTVATGGTATFTVAATGAGTLTYQWQKNGSNVTNGGHYAGCTTATLTISNCDSNDAATYRCVVTGDCGSATSNGATLTVTTVQTIINDPFSYADQAAFQAAWPPVGTSLSLSTYMYKSSPKSALSLKGSTARANKRSFTETYGTDASPIVLTFWLYDGGGATGYQWVELRDYSPATKQLIEVGVYTGCSTTYYAARVTYSPGDGWKAMNATGAPVRSVGWHQFKVVLKGTKVDFYVDNVLGSGNRSYATAEGAVSFELIRIGSGYASTSVSAYYDDVVLQKGQ